MITYTDKDTFIRDVQKEIDFFEQHNPYDEYEVLVSSSVHWKFADSLFNKHSEQFIGGEILGLPYRIDDTLPPDKADVVLKK